MDIDHVTRPGDSSLERALGRLAHGRRTDFDLIEVVNLGGADALERLSHHPLDDQRGLLVRLRR